MKLIELNFRYYPTARITTAFWYASRYRFGYYWYPHTMRLDIIDWQNMYNNKNLKLPPQLLTYMKLKYP